MFNKWRENKMAIRKKKENKLTVQPSERSGQVTPRRPFDLWSEMDNIFDNFRSQFDDLFWPWGQRSSPTTSMTERRTPPLDVADLGDRYEMRLEMPGIPKDDINIEVTPNTIEIQGQHDESKQEKDKHWLRRERSSMHFYRALELPEELKTDNVDAELRDGILTITLPKLEPKPEEKPRKIKIK
jgi:HSP20 family protein